MQRLPLGIKRKISLGSMKTKIMMTVIQTILMKMMKTNIILEIRASMILGKFLLLELKDTYKALSMKEYNIQWIKIHTRTQMRQRRSLLID